MKDPNARFPLRSITREEIASDLSTHAAAIDATDDRLTDSVCGAYAGSLGDLMDHCLDMSDAEEEYEQASEELARSFARQIGLIE